MRQQPPELVAEREVEIGPDGTVKVDIDTGLAKAMHGDQDHRYTITAEVVDASRRTIVGAGTVLVARKPFKVYAWVDRGHYRVGDTIQASFTAHTLDNKPVEGKGELTLLRITYRKDKSGNRAGRERPVQTWKLDTDARGPGPAANDGRAGRAISPLLQADRRARSTPSRAATSSRSSARVSTARSSASTTWNWSPTSATTRPATR